MNMLEALVLIDKTIAPPLKTDLEQEAGVIFDRNGAPVIAVDCFHDRKLTDHEAHVIASVIVFAVNELVEHARLVSGENCGGRPRQHWRTDANNPDAICEANYVPKPDSPLLAGNPGGAMGIEHRQNDDQRLRSNASMPSKTCATTSDRTARGSIPVDSTFRQEGQEYATPFQVLAPTTSTLLSVTERSDAEQCGQMGRDTSGSITNGRVKLGGHSESGQSDIGEAV